MQEFIVPDLLKPKQLNDFIRRDCGVSITQWRRLKASGAVFVNGRPATANTLLHAGDRVAWNWVSDSRVAPFPVPLHILFEDDHFLAINKPAGMLVHPVHNERSGTLANGVMEYYRSKNCPNGFHPVHRLDRSTSGIVLVAKTPWVQNKLSHPGCLQKIYLAIITGCPAEAAGLIDAPIGRKPGSIIERIVSPTGQSALTRYRVLDCQNGTAFVRIQLLTGRTHQIRVHFSHLGHPLLGDDLYGGKQEKISRQALHAAGLYFIHPITKKPISLHAPLPQDMYNLLIELGYTNSPNWDKYDIIGNGELPND